MVCSVWCVRKTGTSSEGKKPDYRGQRYCWEGGNATVASELTSGWLDPEGRGEKEGAVEGEDLRLVCLNGRIVTMFSVKDVVAASFLQTPMCLCICMPLRAHPLAAGELACLCCAAGKCGEPRPQRQHSAQGVGRLDKHLRFPVHV